MNASVDALAFLAGDGEMARLIRAYPWERTSLGPPSAWPAGLRVMARMALTTGHPVFIFWGRDGICLYNDAYSQSIGPEKHPGILGMTARDAWPEIWHIIGPQIEQVMDKGVATWHENQLVPIQRNGKLEDVYWTYSYGPIEDASSATGIGGVLVLCTETTKQVVSARHLAAQHENFSRLFEQAPSFMALLEGPEHVFQLANPAYLSLVGREDILGKSVAEALPEAAGQGYVELLDKVLRTGQPHEGLGAVYRYQLPGQPARTLALDFVYPPIFDAQGVPTGIFVLGIDVSSRNAAREALALSEEQLRLATEAGDIGLWDLDPRAGTLYWTPRLRAMFDVSPDVVPTLDLFLAGVHPDDREHTVASYTAAMDPALRATYQTEYRVIGAGDGVVRWVAAKGRGKFDGDGVCVRLIGVAVDVTERKNVERELLEKNEALGQRLSEFLEERKLLADIVDGTDAFVQVADLSYRWLAINDASANEFLRIFGVKPKVGDSMLDLLADRPEHQAAVRSVWSRALAGEEFVEVGEFGAEELQRRHYEMRFRTLRSADGRRIGAYQFVYDVTERIRSERRLAEAEAALAQAQKMEAIGQLTGGIAHDFNNLLQVISTNFEIIKLRATSVETVLKHADKGRDVTAKAARLTSQLLSFSREQAFELKSVSLLSLLTQMEPLLKATLGATIDLSLEVPADDVRIAADATQLEMAILNLAINARDAMAGVGTFRSVVAKDGDFAVLSFIDSGTGMPPDVLAKCFDPFFTTKPVGKGSGLGLSQVYGMRKKAGGLATVSSAPGHGTTVVLRMPLSRDATEAEGPSPAAAPGAMEAYRGRILVVDDDDDVREVIVAVLESFGYEVHAASDGAQGLSLLQAVTPDLLLVDFAMPGMNGATVARHALEVQPSLHVVFASGHSDVEAIHRAVGAGVVLLRKPFEVEELRTTVGAFFA